MCDFSKGIKLCSCDGEQIELRGSGGSKPDQEIPLIYIWRLYRLIQKTHPRMLGKFMTPSNDIGEGLNAEWIAQKLNEENCFDFNYQPGEGDYLKIQRNEIGSPFISFAFKKGKWQVEHYSPFKTITKHLQDGLLKSVDGDEPNNRRKDEFRSS